MGATCNATFAASTTVTLTATPSSGHTFAGWGGACSGTSTTCVVDIAEPQTVTATFNGTPTITYYHTDMLGSVRAITDGSGSTVTRHDFFAFGESSSLLTGDPRRYIGGEIDAESAFEYLGARYYRNLWGRFTSVDPIFSGGAPTNPQLWNRYAYSLNSPLRYSDATGLAPDEHEPYRAADYGPTGFDPAEFEGWAQNLLLENMLRAYKAGLVTGLALLNSLPFGTVQQMWNAVDMSNAGTPGKKNGGFREAGFNVNMFGPWSVISDVYAGPFVFAKGPSAYVLHPPASSPMSFTVHVHPKGGGPDWQFQQDPSEPDKQSIAGSGYRFGIVIAAGEQNKVYFYDGGGSMGAPTYLPRR